MTVIFDLLGDPIPPGWGKRGRPQHIASEKNRNKVMALLALGWSNSRIANALGITPPTFRKNYFRELRVRDQARDRFEARIIETLAEQAAGGSVAAIRELNAVVERSDLRLGLGLRAPEEEKPEKGGKLGKKEEADIEAKSGHEGTGWAKLLPN